MALFFSGQEPISDEPQTLPSHGVVTINVINKFCNVPIVDKSVEVYGVKLNIPNGHYKTLKSIVDAINTSSQSRFRIDVLRMVDECTIETIVNIYATSGHVQRLLNLDVGYNPGKKYIEVHFDGTLAGSGIIASVLGANIFIPYSPSSGEMMTGKTSGVVKIDWSRNVVMGKDVDGRMFEMVDAVVVVDGV